MTNEAKKTGDEFFDEIQAKKESEKDQMKYKSTRNKTEIISSSQAIIQGISNDGGLFVPVSIPTIKDIDSMIDMDYKELAFEIMSMYFTDFNESYLKSCIEKAYDEKFSGDIAPVKKEGEAYFLELFHGPTFAFKDMALSILPHLLKEASRIQNIKKEILILTATSGDTGKAALEGFADLKGINIAVFYPSDGVSSIQKLQMTTQEGRNVFVSGIRGNFDDAQSAVKSIFNDEEFKTLLDEKGYIMSSANSINIGRLIPQIVYYFYGYLTLLKNNEIQKGEKINVAVPTGNFGNILAAYYAKKMGLPLDKLICASNENNILSDFFTTNTYDKRRELKLTSSPSMDILISSNLERLLFDLVQDEDKISEAMQDLSEKGIFEIKANFSDFYADFASEDEVRSEIKRVFEEHDYLMDPHTAVASCVYEKYKKKNDDDTKTIIVSTASPYKFAQMAAASIGLPVKNIDEFTIIKELEKKSGLKIPAEITSLEDKKILHSMVINKEDMKKAVMDFLEGGRDD